MANEKSRKALFREGGAKDFETDQNGSRSYPRSFFRGLMAESTLIFRNERSFAASFMKEDLRPV